jgi:hypothetical protein
MDAPPVEPFEQRRQLRELWWRMGDEGLRKAAYRGG